MTVILDPGNKPESYSDSARRQWQNTAGLWKTDYGTTSSALTAMTASRDYWQHTVAHNNPNVWDDRYNAGYAAGDAAGHARGYGEGYAAGSAAGAASKTTTGAASTAWTNIGAGALSGTPTGDLISLVAPRAGLAHASCIAGCGQGGGNANAQLHLYVNGGLALSGPTLGAAAASNPQFAVVQHQFNVAAGQTVSIRATGTSTAHLNQGGTLLLTVGSV